MQRRKPLQAKTPLRRFRAEASPQDQSTPLNKETVGRTDALAGPGGRTSSLNRTRLRQVGAAARRRSPEWLATVAAVRGRCHGNCEACGRACERVDPHHVFRRGNRIERSVADLPELVAGLCRMCHDLVEQHPQGKQQRTLEWVALARYARLVGVDLRKEYADQDFEPWTPLQILRDILRRQPQRAA